MLSKLTSVHSQASYRGPNVQPATSTSLTELSELVMYVARNANGCTGILADLPDLSTLQPHIDELPRHDLGAILAGFFVLGDDGRICACASAENSATIWPRTNVVNNGPDGNHVHRQAVPPPASLCSKNTGINYSTHAVEQVFWDASSVALHNIARPHSICSNDIALPTRRLFGKKRNVCTAARVVLDAVNCMWAWSPPIKVDGSDSPFGTSSTMSHGDDTTVIPASLAMALLRESKGKKRSTLPQMVVDRPLEMSKTRCPWFICSHKYRGRRRLLS